LEKFIYNRLKLFVSKHNVLTDTKIVSEKIISRNC